MYRENYSNESTEDLLRIIFCMSQGCLLGMKAATQRLLPKYTRYILRIEHAYYLSALTNTYLVLMQATMSCQQFVSYITQRGSFAGSIETKCVEVPVVHSLQYQKKAYRERAKKIINWVNTRSCVPNIYLLLT